MGSEDVLVEIHPRELRFLFEVKKQSSCSVHLANRSDQYVAFKIKTTSPKRYCVRPNVGVILPRASQHFVVTMQAQKNAPPDLQIKDKFLVQTTVVPFGTADEDIVPAFFSKETDQYIEENKLRVVLVSTSQPQEEQLITGVAHAKSTVEVPMAEEILDNMNEVPNVVNEVHHPLKASYPPLRETPAILSEIPSPVKESRTVLQDFLVPSKEAPFSLTESAPILKETSAVSVESHYSSTKTSATLNESPPLKDTPAPRELAILSDKGPANAENLDLSHVTEDVQNLQSKLNNLEAKLEDAETLIVKLREETRTTIQERDKLQKDMVFLKRGQAGFPLLFVLYMAFVGMSLGYLLHVLEMRHLGVAELSGSG
ncbi:vesicle-associated protein 2-2-like isoform X2 [Phragmites australis]|uniref:vesicle-associated protein 2-2-like isoform X2 n=1 Tax=Phragmites australis TaxID=29695 RepID=UPI002D77E6C6|nr:vesicle-associated protein 2-2-like isoform X2 [Phragmites australis]